MTSTKEDDPLLQMPAAKGIAKCLREMDSPETSMMFAAVMALKRFLRSKNKKFEDLARCVEAWARHEEEYKKLHEVANDIFDEAYYAQYEDGADGNVGGNVGSVKTNIDTAAAEREKVAQNDAKDGG
jgi:hypothetical protein